MNTSGILQSYCEASLTLQETRSINDSMDIPKSILFFFLNLKIAQCVLIGECVVL